MLIGRCVLAIALLMLSGALEATPKPQVDKFAQYVKAESLVSVSGKDGPYRVQFATDGQMAAVRAISISGKQSGGLIARPADVVLLLADKRMSYLWEPLKQWAGDPSLVRVRESALSMLRGAAGVKQPLVNSGTTIESVVRNRTRSLLQLAAFLEDVGRLEEAKAVIKSEYDQPRFKKPKGIAASEWSALGNRYAGLLATDGQIEAALAEYAHIERTLAGGPFGVNATVNRARLLAEVGRSQEALQTINAAWAEFNANLAGDKVPGSERQFAWIRACALQGLDRSAEARAELKSLVEDRELTDEDWVIASDNSLKFTSAMCMKDLNTAKAILIQQIKELPFGSVALIWLQPAYTPRGLQRGMILKLREDQELRDAVAERMQVLPPEMTPALNGWRDSSHPITPPPPPQR